MVHDLITSALANRCADCRTKPADLDAFDHFLSIVPGLTRLCTECAVRRCMEHVEHGVTRLRAALNCGDLKRARSEANEATSWLIGAVEAAEGKVPA